MEEWEGYVEHIVYRNEENGYTVLELAGKAEEGDVLETCVGHFSTVEEGDYLCVKGQRIVHPIYQEQFQVKEYAVKTPEDSEAMYRYLSSGIIKGIGIALAGRIVEKFGDQTFQIMEEQPERLSEIKGISDRKAREIAAQFLEKTEMRNAMIFLQKYGIRNQQAVKIYKFYGGKVMEVIRDNPYRLAKDISGVGFISADKIAMQNGLAPDADDRVKAAVSHVLNEETANGHIFLPAQEVEEKCTRLLGIEVSDFSHILDEMRFDHEIRLEEGRVYLTRLYHTEKAIARILWDLKGVTFPMGEHWEERLQHLMQEEKIEIEGKQLEAIQTAMTSGVVVVTGGPGTGKTTTVRQILTLLEEDGNEVLLCAPTGRAAKRLTETTGREAQTIHRMLGFSAEPDGSLERDSGFERDEFNPLEADAIIVDEMSMVDLLLFHSLLKAVPVGAHLILVGDMDQLPSVGPGNVLRDMIESETCPVVKLTKIFRQAAESDIIINAHRINTGEMPKITNDSKDFFFIERENDTLTLRTVLELVQHNMPSYTHCKPYEVQVLTPMRKGNLGIDQCNLVLQRFMNPPEEDKPEIEAHGVLFRQGDKVIQVKNNYKMAWHIEGYHGIHISEGTGVFNGDCGEIQEIDLLNKEVTVRFEDDKMALYTFSDLEELELAYAITIHKSQGSEYPAVVIPLNHVPPMLANKNLLYTAVTRAKKCVVLVGNRQTLEIMVSNRMRQVRNSSLKKRLMELMGGSSG